MDYYIFIIMLFVGVGNAYINMNPYKQQILDLHNNVRRMEPAANMQLMRWNTQLENEATMWAANCMFDHQQAGRGENLAMHTAPWDYAQLITTGITMWADEKQQYTYGSSGFSSATGHYTQMVWAETTDVGCGMTRCPSLSMGGGTPMQDAWFFVCFYTPPGNFIGQLPYISGQQCSQCNRGQHCDMGLCSDYPGGGGAPGGQMGGGGGGGGAPGGHMGGGGAPGGQMGGGGGAPGGQMGGGGGAPSGQMGGGGGAPGGHGGGAPGGNMGSGGGAPGGQMGGGGGSGGHAGGSPGGQMGAGPTQSSQHGGGPSSAGNMGVIGGGPGMPQIQFINGFPHISLGNPPASGGAGSNQPTGSGNQPQGSGNQPTGSGGNAGGPPGSGVVSKNPAGSITIWGFQGGSQNKPRGGGGGAGGCTDQPWCSMWVELCADPKYSTKIARDCPVSCGQCPQTAGGPGQGGQGGGGPACVDAIEGCVFWKQIGMCHIPFFQAYITETCARTCNMC